jgi:hypothetical protein
MACCFVCVVGNYDCRCSVWQTGCESDFSTNAYAYFLSDLYADSSPSIDKHECSDCDANSQRAVDFISNFFSSFTIRKSDSTAAYCRFIDGYLRSSCYTNFTSHG